MLFGKINDIIEAHDTPFALAVDDFNADLQQGTNQKFGVDLMNFWKDKGLVIGDLSYFGSTNLPKTFMSNHGTTSWLDHIVATYCGHALIDYVLIEDDNVSSGRMPLVFKLTITTTKNLPSQPAEPAPNKKVGWCMWRNQYISLQHNRKSIQSLSTSQADYWW